MTRSLYYHLNPITKLLSSFFAMLFHIEDSTRENALKVFDKTNKSVEKDVEIIRKWLRSQPHLPEIMEDVKIKNFLTLNKYSIEKTKQKIDMYYTIRSLLPDMFEKSNPNLSVMKRFMDNIYCCLHPKLIDGLYRLYFFKAKTANSFLPAQLGLQCNNIAEVRLYEDCMVGDIIVFDMSTITMNDLTKTTPVLMSKLVNVYGVYSMPIKQVHIINSPAFVSHLMFILKSVLNPKIFSRIQIHQNSDILKQILSHDELPVDYGGRGPSLEKLNKLTISNLSRYQKRFDLLDTLRVKESARPDQLNNDEVLGFYGNFKKLDVD